MTKFKVGDKVRILNASASRHNGGDVGTYVGLSTCAGMPFYNVEVAGITQGYYEDQLELVDKPTKNQRIAELESKVAELEAKFAALKEAL